jgi:flagellar basal body-associated protein FliL
MNKKLKVTLILIASVAFLLGLVIITAPITTQQLIASWFETAHQEYVAPSQADQIKLLGPANSRSNLIK